MGLGKVFKIKNVTVMLLISNKFAYLVENDVLDCLLNMLTFLKGCHCLS